MAMPTVDNARLALAASGGIYSRAARALGCTVAELRSLLGAPDRRGRRVRELDPVAVRAALDGRSVRAAAALLRINESTLRGWLARSEVRSAQGEEKKREGARK